MPFTGKKIVVVMFVNQDLKKCFPKSTAFGKRLTSDKYKNTKFFVFADTVATSGTWQKKPGSGWIGLRFQTSPGSSQLK